MAYARTKKHYRAAKKQVEQKPLNGIFIANRDKSKLAIISAALAITVFMMGLLIGILVNRD